MHRAQLRDAAHSSKFFFRKSIFPPASSRASNASSSGNVTPVDGVNGINGHVHGNGNGNGTGKKERHLRNCFPPIPPPEEGLPNGSVESEYEEMTMNEIMNGKVCIPFPTFVICRSSNAHLSCVCPGRLVPRIDPSSRGVPRDFGRAGA